MVVTQAAALNGGYQIAFWAGAVFAALAAIIGFSLFRGARAAPQPA
jgi:hypothetical protein